MTFEFDVHAKEYCSEKLQIDQLQGILRKLSSQKEPWFIVHDSAHLTVVAPATDVTFTSSSYRLLTFHEDVHEGSKPDFLFRVTEALAAGNIPFLPVTSFNRLHILVKSEDQSTAEKAIKSIKVVK